MNGTDSPSIDRTRKMKRRRDIARARWLFMLLRNSLASFISCEEGGREGGRKEGGREGEREREREGGREGGRELQSLQIADRRCFSRSGLVHSISTSVTTIVS